MAPNAKTMLGNTGVYTLIVVLAQSSTLLRNGS